MLDLPDAFGPIRNTRRRKSMSTGPLKLRQPRICRDVKNSRARGVRRKGMRDDVDDHEVVAEAVHFGEFNFHGTILGVEGQGAMGGCDTFRLYRLGA